MKRLNDMLAAADAVIDVLATEDAVLARYEGMGHRDVEVQRIDRDAKLAAM